MGASDLIFMATTGSTVNRAHVKREIKLLKDKGVRIVVLDVDFKNPSRKYQNTIHDIASGPREIFQFDFKQMNTISQSILDVKCAVKEEKGKVQRH